MLVVANYSVFLDEINRDLDQGNYYISDFVRIVRTDKVVYRDYKPIVDYFLDDAHQPMYGDVLEKESEVMRVSDLIRELEKHSFLQK